jgi:Histone methylation protein DOT1
MTTTIVIVVTFFVVLSIILWIWLSVVWWSLKNGISPMPTSEKVKRKVLDFIPPETQGMIVDLGSGWGNVVMQLAKKFPHCHIVGYETSPIPYYFSRVWALFSKHPNLKIYRKNFFNEDLSEIALVYCYLYPGAMKELREKFINELKPGTIVFSNTFAIPDWEPVHVVSVKDLYNTRIYMYMKSSTNIDALHAKPECALSNQD